MKKIPGTVLAFLFLSGTGWAQNKSSVQPPTLAIHFFLNDFKGAANVRSSSLSTAIRTHQFGKLKDMTPGLAVNYIQGLSEHFDLTTSLGGSFLDYPFRNRGPFNKDAFLLEGDFSVRAKMVNNNYWISPYLQVGVGASKYKGYFGGFLPAGAGIQINIFEEAFILINTQYRIPITETTNYHFYHSVGLAGSIGRKKQTP
ncbi:MAG TPA: hypothetical protein VM012_06080 [Flavitalea sp.]|nr:hypothetical protein [Flavitalea sp.]